MSLEKPVIVVRRAWNKVRGILPAAIPGAAILGSLALLSNVSFSSTGPFTQASVANLSAPETISDLPVTIVTQPTHVTGEGLAVRVVPTLRIDMTKETVTVSSEDRLGMSPYDAPAKNEDENGKPLLSILAASVLTHDEAKKLCDKFFETYGRAIASTGGIFIAPNTKGLCVADMQYNGEHIPKLYTRDDQGLAAFNFSRAPQ